MLNIQPKQTVILHIHFCALLIFALRLREFSCMMCLSHTLYDLSFPAEMGLFPMTQFPGNRTPISLQDHCLWWLPCGAWPTHLKARWDPTPVLVEWTWFWVSLMRNKVASTCFSVCVCPHRCWGIPWQTTIIPWTQGATLWAQVCLATIQEWTLLSSLVLSNSSPTKATPTRATCNRACTGVPTTPEEEALETSELTAD